MNPGNIIPLPVLLNSTHIDPYDATLPINFIPKTWIQNNHMLVNTYEALSPTKNICFLISGDHLEKEDGEEKKGETGETALI